ncbi:hypothetical protein MCO_00517, partial [Bartonella sp. DB5-6]
MKKLYTTPKAPVVGDFKNSYSLYRSLFIKVLSLASVIVFLSNVSPVFANTQIINNTSNDFSGGTNVLKGIPPYYVVGSKLYRDIDIDSTFMGDKHLFTNLGSNIQFETKIALDTAFAGTEGFKENFKNVADASFSVKSAFPSLNSQLVEIKALPTIGEKQKNPSQGDDWHESTNNFPFVKSLTRGLDRGLDNADPLPPSTLIIGRRTDEIHASIFNSKFEPRILLGIADGKILEDSTDAVNGSQLYKLTRGFNINLSVPDSSPGNAKPFENPVAAELGSIAIGSRASVSSGGVGNKAFDSIAIGTMANVKGRANDNEISSISNGGAIAIGKNSSADANSAISIGFLSEANQLNSIALGSVSKSLGEHAVAIGYNAIAKGEKALSLGYISGSSIETGIALGAYSKLYKDNSNIGGYDPRTKKSADKSIKKKEPGVWSGTWGSLSLGDSEEHQTRRIENVAAGFADSDAVNVAQLKALQNSIDPNWELSVDGKNNTNVNSTNPMDLAAGSTNLTITKGDKDNKVKFDLARDISTNSISANNIKVGNNTLDATGLVISNGPKITTSGLNAGGKKITGVATGTEANDAVNFAQLKALQEAAVIKGFKINTTSKDFVDPIVEEVDSIAIGSNAKSLDNGSIALGAYSIADIGVGISGYDPLTRKNAERQDNAWISNLGALSIGDVKIGRTRQIVGVAAGTADTDAVNVAQLKALQEAVYPNWELSVDGKNKTNVNSTSPMDLAAGSTNLTLTKGDKDNKVKFDLARSVIVDKIQVGNNTLDATGLVISNGPKITTSGIDAGGKRIQTIANGEISATSADAVGGNQLHNLGSSVAKYFGGNTSYQNGTWTASTFIVKKFSSDGTVSDSTYNDVTSAFAGIGDSFANVKDKFQNIKDEVTKEIEKDIATAQGDSLLWD